MLGYFHPIKESISNVILEILQRKRAELSRVNSFGSDACDRLSDFSRQGKMIRGGLVAAGFDLFTDAGSRSGFPASVISAGAAMELFQAGLLIHDDIMDRDQTRRGHATIFRQYSLLAEKQGIADSAHLGESLGICAGDIAYFLAYELLSAADVPGQVTRDIVSLSSRELVKVGIAQMLDVSWGSSDAEPPEDEILRMYVYKTGRYTFSLPLILGAVLAGASEADRDALGEIGENLGIVFQIRDDELGLFGDERETGKPVGSDVKEGKKTLFASHMFSRATEEEAVYLRSVFGNPRIGTDDLDRVRAIAEKLGTRNQVLDVAYRYEAKARSQILDLPATSETARTALLELLDFTLARTK